MKWFSLTAKGVLGMNARNAHYISRLNPRSHYPLVDDKLRTKRLAERAGIAVPPLYGVIRENHELSAIRSRLAGYADFVIKPAHGSGGNGILSAANNKGVLEHIRIKNTGGNSGGEIGVG